MNPKNKKYNQGDVLLLLLIVIFIFSLMMTPIVNWAVKTNQAVRSGINREQALQIAEAGINYYQWRLAHYPNDFMDGTGVSGPYLHDYTDLDAGGVIGQYSLEITPPVIGSTIVTIKSTGWTLANPSVQRTITTRYGIPSLAVYSFLSNDIIWIGPSETVSGQMQSNNGIRFDGFGNAPIGSAKATYTCSVNQGTPCPVLKNGVWGAASVAVQSFWQFPVPAVDFSSVTSDLAALKSSAQSGGLYLPPSNVNGYSLVFNNPVGLPGTVSVYKVTTLQSNPAAKDVNWTPHNEYVDYVSSGRVLQYGGPIALPANGIIYIEDNTWVEGTLNGRVMVAAAKLPYVATTAPTIYIPNNILYKAKDGSNVLGLLAQKDIVITYHAPLDLEVDAALIAQNGSTQFMYYGGAAGSIKNNISIYGSIMSFGQWTWNWVSGSTNVSGYATTSDIYDNNLLYGPPPGFPLSSSGYKQLSWTSN